MPSRFTRRPAVGFVAGAVAVLLLGAAVLFVPFLTRDRPVIAATPVPDPIVALEKQKVPRGETLCVDSIPFTPEAGRVQVRTGELDGPPQPLSIRMRADGLDETRRVAPAYGSFAAIVVPFSPVRRESMGTVCVRNTGRRSVNIGLTSDPRNISRAQATLNGKPVVNEIPVTLLAPKDRPVLSRAGDALRHVAAFKPGVARAAVWPLLILVLLAVPALFVWGVASGMRESGSEETDE